VIEKNAPQPNGGHGAYRRKVENLQEALRDPSTYIEALGILRALVDRVVVTPTERGFTIELIGAIAHMIKLSAGSESLTKEPYLSSVKVVADPIPALPKSKATRPISIAIGSNRGPATILICSYQQRAYHRALVENALVSARTRSLGATPKVTRWPRPVGVFGAAPELQAKVGDYSRTEPHRREGRDFYLNSDTLRIRRAAAIAGKPGGILEEPEVIRDQTS
jgi:hypothetical protein